MTIRIHTLAPAALAAGLLLGAAAGAAPGDLPVKPLSAAATPAAAGSAAVQSRTASLPAKGLFTGDQLTPAAQKSLTDFIVDAIGLDVEVALLVPTGPWKIDDRGQDERSLTPARLQALRQFFTQRGVDPKRIYVESRVDDRIKEPRLDLQLMGRPSND